MRPGDDKRLSGSPASAAGARKGARQTDLGLKNDTIGPMAFREIVGHSRIVSLLARSIAEGSVPPSLIFAGPEGVGKRRTAEALAQALNCQAPMSGAELPGCGICATCTRISRGVFPDVRLVA